MNISEIVKDWNSVYKEIFDTEADFSKVYIPPIPIMGKWRLLFILKAIKMGFSYQVCQKLFEIRSYCDDLDKDISINSRSPVESYAIWVRDEPSPTQEFLGKTIAVDPKMGKGITLLERIIFEIKYFTETGQHLDVKGQTFCSGSRNASGFFPTVDLNNQSEVDIFWHAPDFFYQGFGIREVVSMENFNRVYVKP
ncbi:MAG: hypothetical protein V4439_01310 [Patescibacteria group bacterium]